MDLKAFIDKADDTLVERIVETSDGKWRLLSHKGKNLGTYNTKKEAEAREKQVQMFKHMAKENNDLNEIANYGAKKEPNYVEKKPATINKKVSFPGQKPELPGSTYGNPKTTPQAMQARVRTAVAVIVAAVEVFGIQFYVAYREYMKGSDLPATYKARIMQLARNQIAADERNKSKLENP